MRDFVLMEEDGESRKLRILMTVEGTKTNPEELVLQLREFSSFDLLYETEVTRHLWLLDSCPNQENPHFMEGSSCAENENRPGSDVVQGSDSKQITPASKFRKAVLICCH